MGGGGNKYSDVNRMAMDNQRSLMGQQGQMYNSFNSGLQSEQNNANSVFNAALGGYNNLLSSLQGGGKQNQVGGGGGVAGAKGKKGMGGNPFAGLKGPGNPWEGQLGADLRTRGESILPSFFDRIKAEEGRLQNIQGGYNPGYTAQLSKLSRDQAQATAQNLLNTNIQLGEQSAAADKAQAMFGLQRAGAMAKYNLAQRAAAGRASSAARASQQQNYAMQLAALGGLSNLRTDTPGGTQQYIGGMLGNQGQGWQGNNQGMSALMNYNQPKAPIWQQALGIAGSLAPVFAGGFGGGMRNASRGGGGVGGGMIW